MDGMFGDFQPFPIRKGLNILKSSSNLKANP